ncbi:transmembrane histidine kinase [Liquorilactobacillus ghanensis DSM 18630]|uniref:Signal transduction histidine-protein kinase ArlS n=2 Tax=Liquorilactobacillus ghanensis TaxID=399370 RepID=A0A0R1VXD8_9LACO|nr:transmembrane histidine kinase [Liquorilactobacillus ghanensis DSM 18630]
MRKGQKIMQLVRQRQETSRRFSLKMKWAIGTAIGVLIIYIIFSVLLFQSFSNLLLRQEQQYAKDALAVTSNKLSNLEGKLTRKNVQPLLSSNVDSVAQQRSSNGSLYSDDVFVTLSRKNIGVSIYNTAKQRVFASRAVPVKFSTNSATTASFISKQAVDVYVKRQPIFAKKDHHLLGYIQVTNRLVDYDATRGKLLLIFIVFGLTAALASALLSYFLATWLLRPIDSINETIQQINDDQEQDDPIANVRVPVTDHNDELTDLSRLFNDMLDRMERYIEQQQQFVEDVSHELRTPVAIIQGHLELLNRWGKDDPKVLAESIAASLQEINRMKSLVQEMLDLSRAEQVEINFSNQIADAREIALQVFNNFKMIHPEFVFVLDNDLKQATPVKVYRNHLEQVLIILMDNAVKYSKDRLEIHLSVSKNDRYAEIAVQDFGEGIAQKDIDRVFNRFYRVDKARSRDKGGNGLGLSIAKRLIEGYHGQLTLESVVGQGSIFRIFVPLAPAKPTVDSKNKSEISSNGR